MVRMRGRLHRVGGDAHIAVGAVLEADRAGQAGSQLAVNLAFGGARADRRPRHQIGDVLRRRHVEEFGAGRQTEIVHRGKHVAGETQALVDVEAAVEVRIVDQSLPAHRGARLLEIDAHHDLEPVGKPFAQGGEAFGVVHGGDGIVDRAGTDDDQKAIVGAVEDGVDGVARRHHHARRGQGARYFAHDLLRRAQLFYFVDAKIVCGAQHGCGSCFQGTCRPNKKPPDRAAAVRTSCCNSSD